MFGGMPATGAVARTATNIRSGAHTPVAGIVHAATLLLILLFAAPLASYVPLTTLAAVLFVVAYNMGEWREIATIFHLSKTDIAVWFTTFSLTVFADLTVAVGVGMSLAALLYIYRVAATTTVSPRSPTNISAKVRRIFFRTRKFPPTSRSCASTAPSSSAPPKSSPKPRATSTS